MAAITIENNVSDIGRALDFIEEFCRKNGLEESMLTALSIPTDELLSNTIAYGYDGPSQGRIEISLSIADSAVTVCIKDDAEPFDPTEAENPKDPPGMEPPYGGFGLHLVRHLTDKLSYVREAGRNITTFYKLLPEQAAAPA